MPLISTSPGHQRFRIKRVLQQVPSGEATIVTPLQRVWASILLPRAQALSASAKRRGRSIASAFDDTERQC